MTVEVGFQAFADLTERVNSIHKKLSTKPIYKTVSGATQVVAATGIVECTDRPSIGKFWNILKVVIASTDGHTALAGVIVDVYASTLTDPSAPVISNLVISGGTGNVPSVTNFSRQVEWCDPGEEIFGLFYGATPGQQIVLSCRVAEYNLDAIEGTNI